MRLLILALTLAAALPAADPRQELMDMDRAFAAETAQRGLDGWMAWFAEDANVNSAKGHIKGKAALREFYTQLFQPGNSLKWEPFHAAVSADGTLGYTLGRSVMQSTGPDGKPTQRNGRYITVWRKQPDGKWKVETDIGN